VLKKKKVLRFSKIFGVGRQTSLPKTWKGTRKRKKNKSEAAADSLQDNVDTVELEFDTDDEVCFARID
jgi:hypothetical protein